MTARNTTLYRVSTMVPSKIATGDDESWIHTDCTYMDARTLVLEYMRRGGMVVIHPEKQQKRRDLWATLAVRRGGERRGKGWVR